VKCIETRPPVYLVKDDHGEILEGTFYAEEIQKVIKQDDVYKIQSVPKKRRKGRRVIGRKMFNYKEVLQDMNIEEYIQNPLTCDCSHSPFQYHQSGHVITGDLNIIQHESLRKVISHYKHDIVGSLVRRNDNIFVMKRGKTLNSFLVFKYRLRSTINTILEPQHINWKHNFKIIMEAVEDYARRWIKREVDQDPECSLNLGP
jgi:hypothetical protein